MECKNPRCTNEALERTGKRGPKPIYCSNACKVAAHRYAVNDGSVPRLLIAEHIEKQLAIHFNDATTYDCLMALAETLSVEINMSKVNALAESKLTQAERDKINYANFLDVMSKPPTK